MNKRIDFSKLGGYPLAQEDLDWLQQSYQGAFGALAGLIGDQVIMDGMTEAGGNVSAGWISVGGELVPFAAGAIGDGQYIIEETKSPLTFQDALSKDVVITRVAKFSTPGTYQYADLKRIPKLKDTIPAGLVSMWSGDVNAIPFGWALCDGTNGTPDLSGRFIVGYAAADPDYDAIGKTGGEKTHTLTAGEQGSLNVSAKTDDIGGGTTVAVARLKMNNIEIVMNGGSNQSSYGSNTVIPANAAQDAHENRPPYYTLAYIIKL